MKSILKIKASCLNDLDNFGFKYIEKDKRWFKKVYLGNDSDDRICYEVKCENCILHITRLDGIVLDKTLLDLFNANLIEVGE